MKILQLCKKFPFPLKDGESIAVTSLGRSLHQQGCEITLLAMNTSKHYCEVKDLPAGFDHYKEIHTVELDNRLKPWKAFQNLFTKESFHISRYDCEKFRDKLIALLKINDYDIVQLETLYLAPYVEDIRQHSEALISMRAHNVEHEIWERITANTSFLPRRWYLKYLTNKLKRYETERLQDYDLLVSISHKDLKSFQKFGFKNKGVVIPIGIDFDEYQPDYRSYQKNLSISFIGSMDWMPNVEGLNWFLDKIWSRLSKEYPDLKLHIAGRNTPKSMHKMEGKNIKIHGEVPDAIEFINKHNVMIVPLLSGSGMRAKILEGMSLGKVILSTQLGLEGIWAKNGEEVIIADTPEAFIEGMKWCITADSKLEKMGRKAHDFVAANYDGQRIATELIKAYSSLMVEAV